MGELREKENKQLSKFTNKMQSSMQVYRVLSVAIHQILHLSLVEQEILGFRTASRESFRVNYHKKQLP